jgi:hypothetical protein
LSELFYKHKRNKKMIDDLDKELGGSSLNDNFLDDGIRSIS